MEFKMDKNFIMEQLFKQRRNLEKKGYEVAYICVFGSQNYKLDLYTDGYCSDLDMKAVIVPSLDDIVNNYKPVSTKYEYEYGEIDVKDIRVFIETLVKVNPSYIETLYTPYYIINSKYQEEFSYIINNRDLLVYSLKPLFAKAIYGMMMEKEHAMSHPYPKTKWKIDKWGFCGKQTSHCIRLCALMVDYFINGCDLSRSFVPDGKIKELIIDHKLNKVSLDQAKKDVNYYMNIGKEIKDNVVKLFEIDSKYKEKFIFKSKQIIKNNIITEIRDYY